MTYYQLLANARRFARSALIAISDERSHSYQTTKSSVFTDVYSREDAARGNINGASNLWYAIAYAPTHSFPSDRVINESVSTICWFLDSRKRLQNDREGPIGVSGVHSRLSDDDARADNVDVRGD